MFFTMIAAAAAWTMAPDPLPDLARWNEVSVPGAPFRIDMPMPLKVEPDRASSGVTTKTWKTAYGLMLIEISYVDRPRATSFTARNNLEMLGSGLMSKWKNATYKVSDLRVLGYNAAKLEMEHDVTSGRIRVEHLLIRVGEDDWTVQTSRYVGRDGGPDSMHIFRSIQAPAPAPVLASVTIGRLTMKAFGKPVVTQQRLTPSEAQSYTGSTMYAFDYQGTTKAWLYHLKVKPGVAFDTEGLTRAQLDNVKGQSKPNAVAFSFPYTFNGNPGVQGRGQAIIGEGEEAFRIVTLGNGQDGWVMLMAGPNRVRTEAMMRDMIASIQIRP
ncbi:MAG: hypothetical protein V4808_10680 [Pseudomonadota bacterium]